MAEYVGKKLRIKTVNPVAGYEGWVTCVDVNNKRISMVEGKNIARTKGSV